jgi:hypothetical protein
MLGTKNAFCKYNIYEVWELKTETKMRRMLCEYYRPKCINIVHLYGSEIFVHSDASMVKPVGQGRR